MATCLIAVQSTGFNNFSHRGEDFFKGVGSMRIINYDKRQLAAAHLLHSARYRPNFSQRLYGLAELDTTGHQSSEDPQQV